jgi:DNA polymerase-3 subunit delta'
MQHPDLQFVFPVTGEEKFVDERYAETVQEMRENPLHTFRYEKADSIRLSVTRELLREMSFQPFESPHRVVVMRDADRMRGDQYSALLKSIEEPGLTTVWVITTSRPNKLPATIRSRCQRVRFSPLSEATIREFLEERAGVPGEAARLLAAQSGGSLSRAIEMRGGDPLRLRNEALALLAPAAAGDPTGLWKAAQGFMKYGRTGRETLRQAIEFHQIWLRDILRVQAGMPDDLVVNDDRLREIRAEASRTTPAELRRRLMVLEEAQKAIDGNVTADLTLFSAMARVGNAGGARIGEGAWPPHATPRWDY